MTVSSTPLDVFKRQTEDLAALCAAAKSEPYVTIDTEFLRERTYWSKLCLIQMALPGKTGDAVLVDPIEGPAMSLEPLYDLFRHEACLLYTSRCV